MTRGNFGRCGKLHTLDWLFFSGFVRFLKLRLVLKLSIDESVRYASCSETHTGTSTCLKDTNPGEDKHPLKRSAQPISRVPVTCVQKNLLCKRQCVCSGRNREWFRHRNRSSSCRVATVFLAARSDSTCRSCLSVAAQNYSSTSCG